MTRSGDAAASGEFGAGYWEDRYRRGEGTGRHAPSPALVPEVATLPPGRALDAGCGRGADAIWLALRGWSVTAVDVSATALAAARESARAAGVADRVEWVEADLRSWDGDGPVFDLVTCQYVHAPGPAEDLFRRLARWVAPGGTLLVVGHAAGGRGHGHSGPGVTGHEHPPGAQIRAEQVTACLDEDRWEILVAEPRTHVRADGAGEVGHRDVVVRARRTRRPPLDHRPSSMPA